MKLLPLLLLNLATAAAAVVVYDQVRPAPPPPVVVAEAEHRAVVASLEERVRELESDRGARLGGGGTDPRVIARLSELEELLRAGVSTAAEAEVESSARGAEAPPAESKPADADSPPAETAPPRPEDIRRWRRLREAARREDIVNRHRARFDRALNQLSFDLTPTQRTKVYDAYAGFEPRVGKIWGEIRAQAKETVAAGGTIDRQALSAQGKAQIQEEFAEKITDIIHETDALTVAEAMLPSGR